MQNCQEYQFSNLGAGLASSCVLVYSFLNNLPRQGIMQGMNLRPPTGIKQIEPTGWWNSAARQGAKQHEQHVSSTVAAWSDQERAGRREGIKYLP